MVSGKRSKRLGLRYYTTLVVGLAGLGVPQFAYAKSSGSSGNVVTHVKSSGGACSASYQHIWVTVTDVKAHMTSAGWQDLTPGLSADPVQIDLLNSAPTDCYLATLGVASGLPAGKYQQIRIILDDGGKIKGNGKGAVADNNGKGKGKKGGGTPPAVNACTTGGLAANVYNCIELADGTFVPLSLSSEGKTGIKIPPGQIGGGGLTIADGQGADLDIDFNACESIVQAGKSGKYKLKPTLHADEVDLSALVGGSVVEGAVNGSSVTPGQTAVAGANLWLESQTPTNDFNIGNPTDTGTTAPVENIVATATSNPDGSFEFCPVPAGTYEIVADADALSSGNSSNATITTSVTVTNSGGPNNLVIPLVDDGSSPALLEGLFTTQAASSTGAGDNVAFGGVQPFSGNSGSVQAIVPPLSGTVPAPAAAGSLPAVATIASPTSTNCPDISSPSCPTGANCECFTLALPASNPVIGSTGSYAAPAASPVNASVIGEASSLTSAGTPECSPSNMITDPAAPFAITGGTFTLATNPTLSFGNCD